MKVNSNRRDRSSNATSKSSLFEPLEPRQLMSTYVVNTTTDGLSLPGGQMSLRQAVMNANANPGADTITFSSSVFPAASLHKITLSQGPISFTDTTGKTTVTGPGSAALAVTVVKSGQIFRLSYTNTSVSLNGMTITGAHEIEDSSDAYGGAIYSSGTLAMTNCVVSNNLAIGDSEDLGYGGFGGGIYSTGKLDIANCTFTGNQAYGGNPINPGDVNGDAAGGAIYTTGSTLIENTTITNNLAKVLQISLDTIHGNAAGGGIYASGSLLLRSDHIQDNVAAGYNRSDPSFVAGISGAGLGGGMYTTGELHVEESTISGNTAAGGLDYYADAAPGEGGGILAKGPVTITRSTISGNTALGGTGEFPGNGIGGGILADGTLTMTSSTVSGNAATGGAGTVVSGMSPGPTGGIGEGGGIAAVSMTLTNSTIAKNTATGGNGAQGQDDMGLYYQAGGDGGNAMGGGLYLGRGGTIKLLDSTVSANASVAGKGAAGEGGFPNGVNGKAVGGGLAVVSNVPIADNTIIAGNGTVGDVSGTLASSSSHNLIGTGGGLTNGVNGNHVGVTNPKLSTLGNYGGPTQTMPPILGSLAINTGSNALIPSGVNTDQRGFTRIAGSTVDIGAVEYGNATLRGSVFNDLNANGIRNSDEVGLSRVKLFLDLNRDGILDEGEPVVTTDLSGNFSFTSLPAGRYRIYEVTPTGFRVDSPAATYEDVVVNPGANVTGVVFANTKLKAR